MRRLISFLTLAVFFSACRATVIEDYQAFTVASSGDGVFSNGTVYIGPGKSCTLGVVVNADGVYYCDLDGVIVLDGLTVQTKPMADFSPKPGWEWWSREYSAVCYALLDEEEIPYTPADAPRELEKLDTPAAFNGASPVLFHHEPGIYPNPSPWGTLEYFAVVGAGKNTREAQSVKVVFRPSDTPAGYAAETLNLPYVYCAGKIFGNLSESLVACDCADMVTYALRRAGVMLNYWGPRYLYQTLETLPDEEVADYIASGKGIVVFFGSHVALLYEDNGNGIVDGGDTVIHTLGEGTELVLLSDLLETYPEYILLRGN